MSGAHSQSRIKTGRIGPAIVRPSASSGASIGASWTKQLKHRLKPLYFGSQRLLAHTLFGYGVEALEPAFRSLGIGRGDAVLMHSGFRRASGFRGTPADVIDCLLEVIGADGHLLMMSMPYRGSSQDYAASNEVFDVRHSPSALGLISEVFRRREGVLRSVSPLHPVLACGPLAAWLTADHEKCVYSCGKGSPFERFLSLDGKFLFFDVPYSSLSFMHYVEDLFRDRLPVQLYGQEALSLRARERSGREITVRHYCFSEAARVRRHFAPIEEALLREGRMRTAKIGNTRLLSVSARHVVECAGRLVERGPGFYR
jgi:aminoglycoside 3-N-acetyltransferase